MPRVLTKGKAQLATQVDAGILARYREFHKGRGETMTAALERAMLRDMTYPQPLPAPAPLPDAGPAGKKKSRKPG